jgi:hypothetical protein
VKGSEGVNMWGLPAAHDPVAPEGASVGVESAPLPHTTHTTPLSPSNPQGSPDRPIRPSNNGPMSGRPMESPPPGASGGGQRKRKIIRPASGKRSQGSKKLP